MKNFILKHIKPISIVVGIILISYLIYLGVDMYTQNKINERINEEKKKIEKFEKESIYWKTKSEMAEKESKDLKDIVEKSKQNITTIINKYDEKRNTTNNLSDDESIKYLSDRLNKKDSSK